MKELSIEDKARHYDEAIKRAKSKIKNGNDHVLYEDDIIEIFPELKESREEKPNGGIVLEDFNEGDGFYKVNLAYLSKEQVEEIESLVKKWNPESEDERIRKELIKLLRNLFNNYSYFIKDPFYTECIAWLEKQREQSSNILWHDVSEEPDEQREIFCEWKSSIGVWHAIVFYHADSKTFCEGERIVKNVLKWTYVNDLLGKQGENTYNKELSELLHKVICRFINDPNIPYSDREKVSMKVLPYIERLEKQGEQKPVDMVEPKFKIEEGEWYVCISQFCNCIKGRVYKATSDNRIIDDFGTEYDMHNDAYKYFRLWTIEDAKDGDILRLGDVIAIFKKYIGQKECICYCSFCDNCYCSSCVNVGFEIPIENGEDNVYGCTNTTPATKEQRDLLFQKMKESGYEWDAVKKQLKEIEK